MKIKGNLKTYSIIIALVAMVALTALFINISKAKQGAIVGEVTRMEPTEIRVPTRMTEKVRCISGTTKVKLEIDKNRLDKVRHNKLDKGRPSFFGEDRLQCNTNKGELIGVTLDINWRETGELTPNKIKLLSSGSQRELERELRIR